MTIELLNHSKSNFLCSSCLSVMCSDCREIAEEYQDLLTIRNNALLERDRKIEELTRELTSERSLRVGYETIAKLGLPDIMIKWIDSEARRVKEIK